MADRKQQGKKARKPTNRADMLLAIDRLAPQPQPGQQGPQAWPMPAHQLDRYRPGVPNISDMILRSFQPAQAQAQPAAQGMHPQAPTPPGVGSRTPSRGRPMAQPAQGPLPQRGMLTPGAQGAY